MADRFRFDPAEVAVASVVPGDRPLHVEIGFGKDVRLLREAALRPLEDFVGVEISRKKAASFCRKVAREGLRNVRACQADVRTVLADLPPGSVASFTILFPDPWPKRRHWKNRWINDKTAALLFRALARGGTVTTATDHEGYKDQIRACLLGAGFDLVHEGAEVPAEDRTLFTERFERLNAPVTYFRWRKREGGGAGGDDVAEAAAAGGATRPPS